jgi:Domain of unknown function (DUF1937)
MKTLVYLAVPYSHESPAIREFRFHQANMKASDMMRDGIHVFSPISHTHPIALDGALPTSWDFWKEYDRAILSTCCKLVILMIHGWDESKGIAGEVEIANELGIPIEYHKP